MLTYNANNSTLWLNVPMILNTTTGFYQSAIPGQQANTFVKYEITAYDNAGNKITDDNSAQYYTYATIPEFPSLMLLALFIIASLLTVRVCRGKRIARAEV